MSKDQFVWAHLHQIWHWKVRLWNRREKNTYFKRESAVNKTWGNRFVNWLFRIKLLTVLLIQKYRNFSTRSNTNSQAWTKGCGQMFELYFRILQVIIWRWTLFSYRNSKDWNGPESELYFRYMSYCQTFHLRKPTSNYLYFNLCIFDNLKYLSIVINVIYEIWQVFRHWMD